ncbi:MAG: 16S rRNA processing protein RimM [Clostridia bacterium]|nr:16S rRNA processing protein RimM [Clostridia bacterium]
MQDFFEIGQVVNTVGLKGEIKINPFTEDFEQFDKGKKITLKFKSKQETEYEIENVRFHKNQVILKLKTVDNIDDAEGLRNSYIIVNRESKEPLEENNYYIVDLIGLKVYEDDKLLGELIEVFPTGSNDVYVVRSEDGKQLLLPAIKEVIKEVNLENGTMKVELMEGLK